MKCNECGNTAEFSVYTNFCYELTFAENKSAPDIEKTDEFFDESIPNVFCQLCDSDDIDYSKEDIDKLFELTNY